jgi:capsule biosynthesis phosphatase
MIRRERCIVMDIDGTLCTKKTPNETYDDVLPFAPVLTRLREYREIGFYIILTTSRNMNTYDGNLGLITANTAKQLFGWLDRHGVPYDELHVGKPWPGRRGFYVDDKAVRPAEFLNLSYEEILDIVGTD